MTTDIAFKISKAKTALLMDHPFFGSIAMGMKYIVDADFFEARGFPPTAATNGKVVYFHPEYVEEITADGTVSQLVFLIAHECMHPMLEHNSRFGTRNQRKFNAAADFAVNEILSKENVGVMPPGGCYDPNIYTQGGGTAEGIYDILPDGGAESNDTIMPAGDDAKELEAEWKLKVAQAAQAARMMGKLSVNLQRFVEQVLEAVVPWQDVLQRFLVKCKTEQRTFARFNRRFISQGMYLPGITGEAMGEIVIAIDCSGSIGGREISQFTAEIKAIREDLIPSKVHLIFFDSKVCGHDVFTPDEELVVTPRGGGGTDFAPVLQYIDEHQIEPVACVFLTDLCCSSFGDYPEYPVLWVTTESGTAPFGEVIEMRL